LTALIAGHNLTMLVLLLIIILILAVGGGIFVSKLLFLLLLLLLLLFLFRDQLGFGGSKTTINVPDKIDVTINQN